MTKYKAGDLVVWETLNDLQDEETTLLTGLVVETNLDNPDLTKVLFPGEESFWLPTMDLILVSKT